MRAKVEFLSMLVILTFCLPSINHIIAQDKPLNSLWHYPDGKKYSGKAKTVHILNLEFDKFDRVYVFRLQGEGINVVGFKLFTDTPLWVMTEDSTNIQNIINEFDLNKFFSSYEFESELEEHIKNGALNDAYILQTLGKPDNIVKYFDAQIKVEEWTYIKLGIKLTLKKGIVVSYVKVE